MLKSIKNFITRIKGTVDVWSFSYIHLHLSRHDPDILLGYDVTMMSWGYLIDRAANLNVNLTNQLSRIPCELRVNPEIMSFILQKNCRHT